MKRLLFILAVLPAFYTAQITTFVSGGQEVDISEVPHQVSLQILGENNCGGSIIGNKWILTAAHCVDTPLKASYTSIKAGITKLNTPISTTRNYQIARVILHPNYNSNTLHNDIALLELTQDIEFNSNTQPIRLADSNELYNIGRSTKISGWGYSNPGIPVSSNELRIVETPIMSNNDAQQYYSSPISSNMITTHPVGDSNRKGACQGDSGSALTTRDSNGEVKQIGIACATTPLCMGGLRSPSIYTKVANYIDWIKQYVPLNIKIEGSSVICDNTTQTYTIDNTDNSPIQWQLSSDIEEVNRTANSITIKPKSGFNGLATLTASNGNGNTTKKIWVGKPKVEYTTTYSTTDVVYSLVSKEPNVSLEEQGITNTVCRDSDKDPFTNSSECKLGMFHSKAVKWWAEKEVKVSNICGTYEFKQLIKAPYVDTNPCNQYSISHLNSSTYRLAPFPCEDIPDDRLHPYSVRKNTLIDNTSNENNLTIQISNAMGQIVLTTKNKEFSLAHLLAGTYYARVIKNGQVVHTQTLLKQ